MANEGLGDILQRVVQLPPKDIRHLASAEAREQRKSLKDMTRDEQLIAGAKKYYGRDILIPSYVNWYEEAQCPTCRDGGWVAKSVPVGHPAYGEAFACEECQGPKILERRLQNSEIPTKQLQTFDNYNPGWHPMAQEAYGAAVSFTAPNGLPWLCITGPKGCGKTHLARAAAYHLLQQGWQVRYCKAMTLHDAFHAAVGVDAEESLRALMTGLTNLECLVIDDLGVAQETSWTLGIWENLFDLRYDSLAATIVTSNIHPTDMGKFSDRLESRLRQEDLCAWINMEGVPDYRQRRRE
jgi:DNA replication protein DnaC